MATSDLQSRLGALSPEQREQLRKLLAARQGKAADAEGGRGERIPCVPEAEDYALSFAQKRLWLQEQLNEGRTAAYNLALAIRLRGALDVGALEKAFGAVIAQHAVLRTLLVRGTGEPRQRVCTDVAWRLAHWGPAPAGSGPTAFQARAEEVANQPFDLERESPIRAALMPIGAADHGLIVVLHHIACDGHSVPLLLDHLGKFYGAARRGEELPVPAPPIRYIDYVAWHRAWVEGPAGSRDKAYWLRQFAVLPEPIELPGEAPRPAVQDFAGQHLHCAFRPEVRAGLRQLGQGVGASLFQTLLAAVATFIHRYTGRGDITIGSPTDGRIHPQLEGLVGFLVNTLPLRVRLAPSETFRAVLARVREDVLTAFEHQGCPFDVLVEALPLARDLSRPPLFNLMVGLSRADDEALRLPGLEAEVVRLTQRASKVDLTFHFIETAAGLELDLEFATALFAVERMRRLLRYFATMLDALLAAPDAAIGDAGLLAPGELRALATRFNPRAADYPGDRSLAELFREQVKRRPAADAVMQAGRQYSYAEIDRWSDQVARELVRKLGAVRPEEVIALQVDRSARMVAALLGILKAGGCYLPLTPGTPAERVRMLLTMAGVRLRLVEDEAAVPGWEGTDADLRHWCGEDPPPVSSAPPLPPGGAAAALAYVIFTSGSTGEPKGVLVEQRAVVRLVCSTDYLQLGPGDRVLQTGSLAFDASTFEIWAPLLNGGCLCLPRGREILELEQFGELLEASAATTCFLTTGLFNQLADFYPESFRRLRHLLTGGEKVSFAHINRVRAAAPGLLLLHVYGPTENTTFSTWHPVRCEACGDVPIGRAIAHSTAYILDERGNLQPPGVAGEIHCGGDGLARGYLGRPDLTAERFVPDPYSAQPGSRLYRTGDLGRWDEEGNIEFLGRVDDQVKIRGFRIELGEVEMQLRACADGAQVVVVARPAGGTHELVAYVAGTEGLAAEDLRRRLARTLPDYMIPAHFVLLPTLPLNASGKVDRRGLPSPMVVRAGGGGAEEPGRWSTPAEQALAAVWAEVLGRVPAARDAHYFSAGGDSIKAIQLVARLRLRGFRLTLREIFARPRFGELAAALGGGEEDAVAAEPSEGEVPLTPIQHWFLDTFDAPIDHFNQATLLEARERIAPVMLRRAVESLVARHGMLRCRVAPSSGGEWRQLVPAGAGTLVWREVDLRNEEPGAARAATAVVARALHGSLSLAEGRLVAAALLRQAGADQLLLVIHHWAVDGVSWRILLEELEVAYQRLQAGEAIPRLPAAGSFRAWAIALRRYAADDRLSRELAHWRGVAAAAAPGPGERAVAIPEDRRMVEFPEDLTVQLETAGMRAYGARLEELLLAALARVWSAGGEPLLLAMEGHGRESCVGPVDASRTVGWFTSLWPFLLAARGEWPTSIREVKDSLRAVPERGVGYGVLRYLRPLDGDGVAPALAPRVSFNYLGTFAGPPEALFRGVGETPTGEPAAAHLRSPFDLDIVAEVSDRRLRVGFHFHRAFRDAEGRGALAEAFVAAVRDCARHCAAAPPRPSRADFTGGLASLAELDRVVQRARAQGWEIEDVLPLTPMQEGLVFHAGHEPASDAYADQVVLRLDGPLEPERFEAAWQALGEQHPNLRARFLIGETERPIAVVPRSTSLGFAWVDATAAAETLPELHRTERERRFDLAAGPLLRLTLVRLAPERHEAILGFHHSILDGWSSGLLWRGLEANYRARAAGVAPLAPGASFRDYLRWLRGRDAGRDRAAWRELLAGVRGGTAVPTGVPRLGAPPVRTRSFVWELGRERSERLTTAARSLGLTESSLFQTLWGIWLGKLTHTTDVVFGATVSGRAESVPRVGEIVGLLINTIPVRVAWTEGDSPAALARRMGRQVTDGCERLAVSLADIQQTLPEAGALVRHTLVFENYPVGNGAGAPAPLWRMETAAIHDPMHFEFGLLVVPRSDGWICRIIADRARYPDSHLEVLRGACWETIDHCLQQLERPIDRWAPAVLPGWMRRWVVAATFTAEPIGEALNFWQEALGQETDVRLAPFNQVLQQLLDPRSELRRNRHGFNLVLVRLEDWAGANRAEAAAVEVALEENGDLLVDALRGLAEAADSGRYFIVFCPPSPRARDQAVLISRLDAAEARLRRRLAAGGGARLDVWGSGEIASRYPGVQADLGGGADLGGVPYTGEFFAVVATEVVRRAAARTRPPRKVIALDADHTLWRGVLGEDGPNGIELTPAHRRLQEVFRTAQRAGWLLVLVSKNDSADLAAAFEGRSDFPLRWEDFAAVAAEWRAKSASLRALATKLNLGLDSFVFIDDSALECAEVQAALPAVLVLQVPAGEIAIERFAEHLWPLDGVATTAEDRGRTELYRAETQRGEARTRSGSLREFIRQLQLQVHLRQLEEEGLERAAQLSQRTNQFNASTIRRTVPELRAWLAQPDARGLLVEVADRFGAYGVAGCVLYREAAAGWEVDTLLLSCRVLGRGVEHEVMRRLAAGAAAAGGRIVRVRFVRTARNAPVEGFLRAWAQQAESAGVGGETFVFDCARAPAIAAGDEETAEVPVAAATGPGPERPTASQFFQYVATEVASPEGLERALGDFRRRRRRCRRRPDAAYEAPQGSCEVMIAACWAAVLGVERVGRQDNFFELGGHSLTAVMMVARVNRDLRSELALESIFAAPELVDFAARAARARGRAGEAEALAPVAPASDYPLSAAQRRLWIIEQMRAPGPSPFHMSAVFRLRGCLDPARLGQAFRQLLARHESLRTGFAAVAGEPRQIIRPEVGFAVEALADGAVGEFVERPFDLAEPPLLRVGLQQVGDGEWRMAIVLHHLISDGWSIGVMAGELSALYTDATRVLPTLALQYKDYAAWQGRQLAAGRWQAAAEYWGARLAARPPPLELPADRPRPNRKGSRGGEVVAVLGGNEWEELKRRARAEEVGPFVALLTALQIVLARQAGVRRLIIGSPTAGRDQPELEPQIGFFVNLLPLVAEVDEGRTVREHLAAVKATVTGALSHASYPFDRLVDDLQLPRDLSRAPLFDVLLVFQTARAADLTLDGVTVGPSEWTTRSSQYDLTFEFAEVGPGLRLRLEYDTALYDEPRVARLARQFFLVLRQTLAEPGQRVASLELCSVEELARLRSFERGARFGSFRALTLPQLVVRAGADLPEKTAVVTGTGALTYAELVDRMKQLAAAVRQAGVGAGQAVAVAGRRTEDFVVAMLGVMQAGAIYVPMDLKHPDERLRAMVADGGILHGIPIGPEARSRLAALELSLVEAMPPPDAAEPGGAAQPDDTAYVIYTSGSTGRPKGVEISHGAFATMIEAQIEAFGICREDRCAWWASCAFDASLSEIFLGLAAGATVVIAGEAERADTGRFLAWLQERQVTVATLPPAFLRVLQRAPLEPLRVLITAGETADPEDARHYAGRLQLFNAYGPTETAVCATVHAVPAAGEPGVAIPIGRPLAVAAAYVLDAAGRRAPIGVPGELFIGGRLVGRGYRHAPALTAERFLPDPLAGDPSARMYRTGDRARWREDGALDFLGREDGQIKIRGFRVELGEIEQVLRQLAGVGGAAVTLQPRPGGPALVAYVVGAAGQREEWRAAVAARLPDYLRPAAYVSVDRLPMTTSGKLDRAALPPPDWSEETPWVAPATAVERVLAAAWTAELAAERVGRESDFFALGGDSIKALALSARLQRDGWALGLPAVFAHPRLCDQAAQLTRVGAPAGGSHDGPVALTPIQRWFLEEHGGSPLHHFNLAVYYRAVRPVEADRLCDAVRVVWRRHAALRAVFARTGAGWQQILQPAGSPAPQVAWLEASPGAAGAAEVTDWVRRQQATFDLGRGPLIRYGVIRGGGHDRVLCITHHLVADWVSHRILLEDLAAAYAVSEEAGAEAQPAGELAGWVGAAVRWTREELEPSGVPEAWARVGRACAELATPAAPGRYGDVAVLAQRLGGEVTAAVRATAAGRRGRGLREAILAALGRAHQRVFGAARLTVQLEGHGRGGFGRSADASRTVGWFTALYPCILSTCVDDDESAALARVGDTLAALPADERSCGLLRAYGRPGLVPVVRTEIGFNYLGEFAAGPDRRAFCLERDLPREGIAAGFARDQPLDLSAWIIDGELHLQCAFIPAQYPESAMRRWLEEMVGFLVALGRTGAKGRQRLG